VLFVLFLLLLLLVLPPPALLLLLLPLLPTFCTDEGGPLVAAPAGLLICVIRPTVGRGANFDTA
jgi:hypothetical protein